MKRTLIIATLAIVLPGGCGTALANTGYSQDGKPIAEDNPPGNVYAVTAQGAPGATLANLRIYEDAGSGFESLKNVIGGYVTNDLSAYDNVVTMTGGKVTEMLVGGYVRTGGEAGDNSVAVSGGEVSGQIAGGYVNATGNADRNTVAISGTATADRVYGGFTNTGHANGNTVTMSGGTVTRELVGGDSVWEGNACGNIVIVTGGSVENVSAAVFLKATEITGNKVLISGGRVGTACAYIQHSPQVKFADNVIIMSGGTADWLHFAERIHLAGAGFSGSLEGVEGIVGQALDCGSVGSCDSIDIYGSRISASTLSARVALSFHMVNGLLNEADPMVTLSGTLNMAKGLELSFDALDNMEWKPGDSVTLVNARESMGIASELLDRDYDIYRYLDKGEAETVAMAELAATAHLELEQDGRVLKLVIDSTVPEPATGTLGLLALAALAARRRKR